MTDLNAKIDELLKLKRIARGQLVFEWESSRATMPAARLLVPHLRSRLEKLIPDHYVAGQEGQLSVILSRSSPDHEAHLGPASLMIRRPFTGNVAVAPKLLKEWIEKNWFPLYDCFSSDLKPAFVAMIVEVELSAEGVLSDSEQRELIGRYLRPIPGWAELADAEFRVCKALDERYYLNFALATFRTLNLQVRGAPAVLAGPGEPGGIDVEIRQRLLDHGLKVLIDANTKFNILNNLGARPVELVDLKRCLELIIQAIDKDLDPFLKMAS